MPDGQQEPQRAPLDPRVRAALEEMAPYLLTTTAVFLLAAPTELTLPIVRRLRGRSGVPLGPALVSLANAAAGFAVVHRLRRDRARWSRLRQQEPKPWVLAVPVYLLLSPAAAAATERGVVLRHRSALWGGLFSPVGALHVTLVLSTLRRALRARQLDDAHQPD